MKATDYVKLSLDMSKSWAMGLINDMRDAPMTQPTPNGGNHPIWVLGHIVCTESDLLDGFVIGQPSRFAEMRELFAMGTEPLTDATQYPSLEELAEKFEEIRAATLAYLESLSDDDLDKRSHAPEKFGPQFATIGSCYAAMASHVGFHAGQVADARRAAGRGPLKR